MKTNNGSGGNDVKFYTSTDGTTWTQLGLTNTNPGTTSIYDSTAPVELGAFDGVGNNTARFSAAQILAGIGGTLVANWKATDLSTTTPGTWTDSTGNTWTLTGTNTNIEMTPNNLASTAASATAASYRYSGDGLRMNKTVNGTTTQQTWDSVGELPQLLTDGTTHYLYGPDGLAIATGERHHRALLPPRPTGQHSRTHRPSRQHPSHLHLRSLRQDDRNLRHRHYATRLRRPVHRRRVWPPVPSRTLLRPGDWSARVERSCGRADTAPYAYALDTPLDVTDPSGMCGRNNHAVLADVRFLDCRVDVKVSAKSSPPRVRVDLLADCNFPVVLSGRVSVFEVVPRTDDDAGRQVFRGGVTSTFSDHAKFRNTVRDVESRHRYVVVGIITIEAPDEAHGKAIGVAQCAADSKVRVTCSISKTIYVR